MIDKDCIFCKIIAKETACKMLYEDNTTLAFLDAFPATRGHCLVVPRKHYHTLLDIPEAELKEVIQVVQKICAATMKATKAEGFNVLQNNFAAAGQAVQHLHFHIVPRFSGDGMKLHFPGQKGGEEELCEWEKRIKGHL